LKSRIKAYPKVTKIENMQENINKTTVVVRQCERRGEKNAA
jgi:hypothetical protein